MASDFARAKVSSMQRDARSLAEVDSVSSASGSAAGAKRIGARLFILRDSTWTDARGDASSMGQLRRVRVKPYSAAYFALLRALPELGEPFGLGDRVVIFGRKVAVEVSANGTEQLSEGQVAAVAADW